MQITAQEARREVAALLDTWCGSLVRLQIDAPGDKRLDGGIRCPACGGVHGRCHEAVYPLLCAAELTGNGAYLTAAKRLFVWGENMRCPDGGFRNDFRSEWKGVTAFAAIALHDALAAHGGLLTPAERAVWEDRLAGMGAWLYENLTEHTRAYLNYHAATTCAMALLGNYFSDAAYAARAKRLAAHCLTHVTETGLLCGEGSPADGVSPKGCRAVDVGGYNVEETLPSLSRCADAAGDAQTAEACRRLWRAHLDWMLPDGAWDDSTGTRAFKWTYWGSRTADGCQAALFALGKKDPVFAEAAWRNFTLLRACTHDGLLTGGPDYAKHGEPACAHHTFCHAKVLAAALDGGIPAFPRTALPADRPEGLRYYPELDTYRAACGKWRMDVCGSDFPYSGAARAAGGSVTLLWHENTGPLIAAGMPDETLREPHNQQISVRPEMQASGCPRIETTGGERFAQHYCAEAKLSAAQTPDGTALRARAYLCDAAGRRPPENGACTLEYRLDADGLTVCGCVDAALAGRVRYALPLIGETAAVGVLRGRLAGPPERTFSIGPGFLCRTYGVFPDRDGCFRVRITCPETAEKD